MPGVRLGLMAPGLPAAPHPVPRRVRAVGWEEPLCPQIAVCVALVTTKGKAK